MPVLVDYQVVQFQDGSLTVTLTPPTAIGGQDIRFVITKRFGPDCSGLVTKSMASGYGNGASGITVLDSGAGKIRIDLWSRDTSGLDPGNYVCNLERLDSGSRTSLTKATLTLMPGGRP